MEFLGAVSSAVREILNENNPENREQFEFRRS